MDDYEKRTREAFSDFTLWAKNRDIFLDRTSTSNLQCKCSQCDGDGRIYDPKSPRDPIEGNKMRDRIPCPQCKGLKTMPLRYWKLLYKKALEGYLVQEMQKADNHQQKVNAMNKLTDEDLKVLGLKRLT